MNSIADVENTSVANIGLIASIPIICSFLGHTSASFVADYIRSRNIMSIEKVSSTTEVETKHSFLKTTGTCHILKPDWSKL